MFGRTIGIGAGLWILIHGCCSPVPDPYVHSIGARLAQPLRVSASVGAETLASPSGLCI